MNEYEQLKERLGDREWRLYNLYWVINKQGKEEKYTPNKFQRKVFIDELWYLSVMLKARQLGLSTGTELFMLDMCIFNSNTKAGIIDYTLPDAKSKLDKCRFAYSKLPDWLKLLVTITKDNEQELEFSNGSSINAGTSFRGSTLQVLHISEYAKIAKFDPIKAREIKTGALNAIAGGQFVFIESTGEDGQGEFWELCQRAEKLKISGEELTALDYKFFFFPWWEEESYRLETLTPQGNFTFSTQFTEYFKKLEGRGINLSVEQKFWYVKKFEEQGGEMKKEYPSFSTEAFEAETEDKYYFEEVMKAYAENRVTEFEIDKGIPIDITLDLGMEDYTSGIFTQELGKEIRIPDCLEINRVDVPEIVGEINAKGHKIRFMYLPHDAFAKRLGMGGRDLASQFKEYGFNVRPLLPIDTPPVSLEAGISLVRKYFGRFWFRKSTTQKLIDHLQLYSKKWSEGAGKYVGPRHDKHSHMSDAMRYVAVRYAEPTLEKKKARVIKTKYSPMRGY